jgi:hypothetical protein
VFKGADMAEEVVQLLERYPELGGRERQCVKNWLRTARHVHFAELLSQGETAANLSRACAVDAELRKMLRDQANRQMGYLLAAFLSLTMLALTIAP